MSEDTNPVDAKIEEGTEAVVDNTEENEEVVVVEDVEDVIDDIDDADDVDLDDDDPSGPPEYVASEGGRTGRGGGNLRPNEIDYKNVTQLSRFLDRRGRILSRRKTRVNAKAQRKIAQAVKRARHLALLPYTADQTRIVRKRR